MFTTRKMLYFDRICDWNLPQFWRKIANCDGLFDENSPIKISMVAIFFDRPIETVMDDLWPTPNPSKFF